MFDFLIKRSGKNVTYISWTPDYVVGQPISNTRKLAKSARLRNQLMERRKEVMGK